MKELSLVVSKRSSVAFCSAWCPSSCETELQVSGTYLAQLVSPSLAGQEALFNDQIQSQTNPGGPFQVRNGDLISLKGDGKIWQKRRVLSKVLLEATYLGGPALPHSV